MDLITKKDGSEFRTEGDAKRRQGVLLKDRGLETEVVEYQEGWALRPLESRVDNERKRRIPVGNRGRLTVPEHWKKPGYHYHFVAHDPNSPGNVERYKEAGYEHVRREEVPSMCDERLDVPKGMGDFASIPGGQGVTMFLMKQKQKFYEEDQAAKAEKINRKEAGIKRKEHRRADAQGQYGKVDITQRNAYSA